MKTGKTERTQLDRGTAEILDQSVAPPLVGMVFTDTVRDPDTNVALFNREFFVFIDTYAKLIEYGKEKTFKFKHLGNIGPMNRTAFIAHLHTKAEFNGKTLVYYDNTAPLSPKLLSQYPGFKGSRKKSSP